MTFDDLAEGAGFLHRREYTHLSLCQKLTRCNSFLA
jgi:hypothetical protein